MPKPLFKPGESGNPAGRPKGSKNKTTEEIRKHIQTVLSGHYETLESDLNIMNPFQRVMMIEKLTKFFLPALQKNDDTVEHSGAINITVSFEDLESEPKSKSELDEEI